MKTTMAPESVSDEQLVAWSLTGDRDAFGLIVQRYQALVCSITYGGTGSLMLSEDLAQETFLTAWRKLTGLADATKVRAWLCGIARNLTRSSLRSGQREPVLEAEPLDTIHEPISGEPSPSAQAVSHEEEAILWRALEQIPDAYREPLILFYREHQSIERVAQELELSQDAAKQRLSRGRAMLTERVAAFVEGTLERTTPGKAFTLGVLAALPGIAVSTKAATVGATAAKGGTTVNAAGVTGLLGAIAALFFVGSYAEYRLCLEEIRTDEERRRLKSFYRRIVAFVSGIFVAFAASMFWVFRDRLEPSVMISLLVSELFVIFVLTRFVFAAARIRWQRPYYSRVLAQEYAGQFPAPAWEYRSQLSFLGLPLVHIRIGDRFDVIKKPVTAWVAVGGKYAVGALFAFGEFAIAPASIGWCALGLVPFGGLALGLLTIGACSLGVWTFGGLALGWQAYGACAIAWKAANGWIALAREFALGFIVHGSASVQAAQTFIQSSVFFRFAQTLMKYFAWLNLLWVAPCLIQLRLVARARKSSGTP
ncbi:MAG TPA: sigma-70 family RNA polymerase sigma factor [Verrucomicrobiae bacterium]|nr:sigma-70 family RNA polymerase sigma factor [Verrucomicrobiae bacterium]